MLSSCVMRCCGQKQYGFDCLVWIYGPTPYYSRVYRRSEETAAGNVPPSVRWISSPESRQEPADGEGKTVFDRTNESRRSVTSRNRVCRFTITTTTTIIAVASSSNSKSSRLSIIDVPSSGKEWASERTNELAGWLAGRPQKSPTTEQRLRADTTQHAAPAKRGKRQYIIIALAADWSSYLTACFAQHSDIA